MVISILSNYEQIKGIIKLNYNHYYNDVLLEVINNNKISSKLKENFELDGDFLREDIGSMLYYFGYLTIDSFNKESLEYNFILPNKIITDVFNNYFNKLLNSNNIEIDNNEVIEALEEMAINGNIDRITNIIRDTLNKFSNRMYIGFSEKVIQSMYLMLLKYNNALKSAKEQIDKYDKKDRIKSRNKKMLKYVVIFIGDEYKIYEM